MFALLFTVNAAAQFQSKNPKLNTDGFMDIPYGTSVAKASEIVLDKIGTITSSKSHIMYVSVKPGAVIDLKKYSSDWSSDKIGAVLWFSNDKLISAGLTLPQIPIGKCSKTPKNWCAEDAYIKLKNDLDTFYGQKAEDRSDRFNRKITYRWEFPVGETSNFITLEMDMSYDREKFDDSKTKFSMLFQKGG